MTSVLAWSRLDFRRRWKSLLVMALLVALAAGTVMAATAGARRGASVVDRLQARTLPATVAVLPNQPGFDWDAVRSLPEVEALTTFVLTYTGFVIEELPDGADPWAFPPADDENMRTVERPVTLAGRLANPDRADEVVVTPRFVAAFGLGVGDTVTLRLYTPQTQDALAFTDDLTGAVLDGPTVRARIVGVIRSPWYSDSVGDEQGTIVPSPGFYARYAPNLMGASDGGIRNALVRLHDGEASLSSFKAGLARVSGRTDIDQMNLVEEGRRASGTTGFEAEALLGFAAAAAVAAVFLIGQSVARYAASTVAALEALRAVGMTERQTRLAAALGPAAAGLAGTAVGVAAAVVASRWFPIGTASLLEPAPGISIDVPVLLTGALTVPLLVIAGGIAAAWLALRSARSPTSRRSAVAGAAARLGAPVPVVVGARFALEPGRGAQAVAVRPALVGAVTGVVGVVAAFTFSAGVDDAAANPARFGQVHQLEAFVGFSGEDSAPVDAIVPVVAADPDVEAVNDTRIAVGEIDRVPVTLFTLDSSGAPWPLVLTEGRAPGGPAEVVIAPDSADAVGAAVGDSVRITGTAGERDLTVTGIAFVPEGHNNYVNGGWVTAAGYDTLFDPDDDISPAFKYHLLFLALRAGADPAIVAPRLEEAVAQAVAAATGADPGDVGVGGELSRPELPAPVAELRQIRSLPVFLAAFLVVLALGAVGHALATAVRRRRRDVAVLRALGMTRPQSRGIVLTQASLLALIGLAAGIPLGLALGRTLWRYVADTTPLFYVAPVAALALALVVPLALVATNLLAAWPSQRAASMRVGHVLRAE
ncbi:FtsX-like permease family protein [Jiangella gansuensis]|uniref:FtsX-like permease family protein n=1 Tax=Jiangella gansuensis TaxID=281473 RepID=UPI00047ACC75|nr:FtsX-like permease family protein [Jiangella gansuensis]